MENEKQMLLDLKELSIYLHCSIQTIRKMIANKEIPCIRIGRKYYVSKATIDLWIKKQELIVIQNNKE